MGWLLLEINCSTLQFYLVLFIYMHVCRFDSHSNSDDVDAMSLLVFCSLYILYVTTRLNVDIKQRDKQ